MLVLMCSWMDLPKPPQELEVLELFAGKARLSRLAKSVGIPAQAHDLLYDPAWETKKKSAMNINEPSGLMLLRRYYSIELLFSEVVGSMVGWSLVFAFFFHGLGACYQLRLAILAVLHSKFDSLLALLGVKCSSWVQINTGTSDRDFLNPMGHVGLPSVDAANLMAARFLR